jgi:hypothetical protein
MFIKKLYLPIIVIFLVCGLLGLIGRIYGFDLKYILFVWIILSSWYLSTILKKTN